MLTDEERIILGKLFKIYIRKDKVLIRNLEDAGVSSTKTLYKAMNGEIIKIDSFYIKCSEFLNHKFVRKENFNSWFDCFQKKIINAFDYYLEEQFIELFNELKIELKEYKDCAIYHEYYQVLESLFEGYINNEYLDLNKVYYYLELIDLGLFSKELSLLVIEYMFKSNNNYIGDKQLPELLVEKVEKIDKSSHITLYQKGFLMKYNSNFLSALDLFKEAQKIAQNKNNKYRETQFALAMYIIYRNIDNLKEREISSQLIELKKTNIPNNLKQNINYNVGMQNYLNGRYESSYSLLFENLELYRSYMGLVFVCAICSRLCYKYPNALMSKEIESRYDFIYLNYFRMKSMNIKDETLVKYIMNVIIPQKLYNEKYRNPYWNLFEYEIFEMSKKNVKFRKQYLKYCEMVKQICKND